MYAIKYTLSNIKSLTNFKAFLDDSPTDDEHVLDYRLVTEEDMNSIFYEDKTSTSHCIPTPFGPHDKHPLGCRDNPQTFVNPDHRRVLQMFSLPLQLWEIDVQVII